MNQAALTDTSLHRSQLDAFARNGYLVLRNRVSVEQVQAMRAAALADLREQVQPIEYEADVAYPGAPTGRDATGGDTARRLLQAYDRDPVFALWADDPGITRPLAQLLGSNDLRLTRAHHNCVMTKHPGYSSATLWHQDLRYWSFTDNALINAWVALGDETPDNGCMWLLPGSHRLRIAPARLDADAFLRPEHPDNRTLIDSACPAALRAGDVLLFHAATFHAAGRNNTNQLKLSTVFTFHRADNHALAGSRSARLAPINISPIGGP